MGLSFKFGFAAALLGFASLSASAGETITLRNGYSIHCERREAKADVTRLYLTDATDNFVDVPTEDIVGFEVDGAPPPPPFKPPVAIDLEEVVSAASGRNNVSPELIKSVIRAESGFNPNAVSRKGAQGLMQLMPQTAARLGVRNAMDPVANVEGGARYLGELLARYHNDLPKALAAFNAGPERVEKYHGIPPYPETIAYVGRIIRDLNQGNLTRQRATQSPAQGSREENLSPNAVQAADGVPAADLDRAQLSPPAE
jgi:hypothetical protein